MIGFPTAMGNFVFKGLNPFGRASRSEYWLVMPLVWGALLVLFYLDMKEIIKQLRWFQEPTLNPLAYPSLMVFLLTLVPRITLTMRRIQDSGRSGKWAFLPVVAAVLAFWLVTGALTALLPVLLVASGESVFGLSTALAIGSVFASMGTEAFWPLMFSLANTIDLDLLKTIDLDLLKEVFHVAMSPYAGVDGLGTAVQQPALVNAFDDGTTFAAAELSHKAVLLTLILGPVIAMVAFITLLVLPGSEDANGFGPPPSGDTMAKYSKGEHNPYAGYGILLERPDVDPREKEAARKAEVHSLYKSRVLGQDKKQRGLY